MTTFALLRATTRRGDAAWAVALAVIGALVGATHALAAGGDGAVADQALRFVPLAAMPLLLRYEFSSGPAVLFWFDAVRQSIPGVTRASFQAEFLRFAAFLLVILLPMAAVGAWMGGLADLPYGAVIGVAIAAAGIGGLTAVAPYRWMPFAVVGSLSVVLAIALGVLPVHGSTVLGLGFAAGLVCAAAIRWRLTALRTRGVDPPVGGDYAFVFSLGRHGGSAFSAPDSAPLAVLMNERRTSAREGRIPDAPDARVRALLGPHAWQASVTPKVHLMQWALLIGVLPLLMTVFFGVLFHSLSDGATFGRIAGVVVLMLVVMWGLVMGATMQMQYGMALRAHAGTGQGLDAELRLLPGVAAPVANWDRRLRPLWLWPGLALGGLVLGVAIMLGVEAAGLVILATVVGLELWRMRLTVHAALRGAAVAGRLVAAAGGATGLLLVLGTPYWANFRPLIEALHGDVAGALDQALAGLALVASLLLGIAAWRLHRVGPVGLVRRHGAA